MAWWYSYCCKCLGGTPIDGKVDCAANFDSGSREREGFLSRGHFLSPDRVSFQSYGMALYQYPTGPPTHPIVNQYTTWTTNGFRVDIGSKKSDSEADRLRKKTWHTDACTLRKLYRFYS